MQDSLGDCLDGATLQAMEVSRMMAAAGASQEEIEEMMAMILNKEGAVSPEFIASIKETMAQAAAMGEPWNSRSRIYIRVISFSQYWV